MPLRAIVFDLDDTLILEEGFARSSLRQAALLLPEIDPARFEKVVLETARRHWLSGPYHPLGRRLGFASWEGLWATFEGGHPTIDGLRSWVPDYRRHVWQEALHELGRDDPVLSESASSVYTAAQRSGHPLIDGSAQTVRSLAKIYRIGLLTNGPPDIQRHKLKGTGLATCFDAVAVSGEIGVGKPDPAAFASVLNRLGVEPGDALMVGDSWERDVVGALDVGMRAVWISGGREPPDWPEPSGTPGSTPHRPLAAIDHVGELPAVLP